MGRWNTHSGRALKCVNNQNESGVGCLKLAGLVDNWTYHREVVLHGGQNAVDLLAFIGQQETSLLKISNKSRNRVLRSFRINLRTENIDEPIHVLPVGV